MPEPLLGVTALEGLGIKVDPNTGKLEYSRPYGVAFFKSETNPDFIPYLVFEVSPSMDDGWFGFSFPDFP